MAEQVNGSRVMRTDNHLLLFPKGEQLTTNDLHAAIAQNETWASDYRKDWRLYIGDHSILHEPDNPYGPNNKLVVNMAHYIVDTFVGFFIGIPPKIALPETGDNDNLQRWSDSNSFLDKLNEVAKLTDIYGRAMMFAYQNEDSQTRVAVVAPTEGFMIYDDTIAQQPVAFVRYTKTLNQAYNTGTIYYADQQQDFVGDQITDTRPNPFGYVPAVEFLNNAERLGTIQPVETLIDSLDHMLSNKANQIDYFDHAYLKVLGLNLDSDGDGEPDVDIRNNRMIYSPSPDSVNAQIGFVEKPDADGMQEHMLDRLTSLIYQISMVANLSDSEFAGNQSGVALKYKLLPMQNMAANKERKFQQSLRQIFRVLFSVDTIVSDRDAWEKLTFKFDRNLPANLEDEAETAQKLSGIVSKETQLKVLSVVEDSGKELQRMEDEKNHEVENSLKHSPSAADFEK